MSLAPHDFWQTLSPPGTHRPGVNDELGLFAAGLPDGCELMLPIRVLPGDGTRAVASLIVNQASFAVEDALVGAMTDLARPLGAEVVIGIPTLGLPLAHGVARALGHPRFVALGTSRKFWYRDELSEELSSITTPGGGKRLYLDPRMLPLLEHRRVLLVDDVISSGSSIAAALRLLDGAGLQPVGIVAAMLQTERWRPRLEAEFPLAQIHGVLSTPLLCRTATGWAPCPAEA